MDLHDRIPRAYSQEGDDDFLVQHSMIASSDESEFSDNSEVAGALHLQPLAAKDSRSNEEEFLLLNSEEETLLREAAVAVKHGLQSNFISGSLPKNQQKSSRFKSTPTSAVREGRRRKAWSFEASDASRATVPPSPAVQLPSSNPASPVGLLTFSDGEDGFELKDRSGGPEEEQGRPESGAITAKNCYQSPPAPSTGARVAVGGVETLCNPGTAKLLTPSSYLNHPWALNENDFQQKNGVAPKNVVKRLQSRGGGSDKAVGVVSRRARKRSVKGETNKTTSLNRIRLLPSKPGHSKEAERVLGKEEPGQQRHRKGSTLGPQDGLEWTPVATPSKPRKASALGAKDTSLRTVGPRASFLEEVEMDLARRQKKVAEREHRWKEEAKGLFSPKTTKYAARQARQRGPGPPAHERLFSNFMQDTKRKKTKKDEALRAAMARRNKLLVRTPPEASPTPKRVAVPRKKTGKDRVVQADDASVWKNQSFRLATTKLRKEIEKVFWEEAANEGKMTEESECSETGDMAEVSLATAQTVLERLRFLRSTSPAAAKTKSRTVEGKEGKVKAFRSSSITADNNAAVAAKADFEGQPVHISIPPSSLAFLAPSRNGKVSLQALTNLLLLTMQHREASTKELRRELEKMRINRISFHESAEDICGDESREWQKDATAWISSTRLKKQDGLPGQKPWDPNFTARSAVSPISYTNSLYAEPPVVVDENVKEQKEKLAKRLRMPHSTATRVALLYAKRKEVDVRLERARKAQEEEALKECSFTPSIQPLHLFTSSSSTSKPAPASTTSVPLSPLPPPSDTAPSSPRDCPEKVYGQLIAREAQEHGRIRNIAAHYQQSTSDEGHHPSQGKNEDGKGAYEKRFLKEVALRGRQVARGIMGRGRRRRPRGDGQGRKSSGVGATRHEPSRTDEIFKVGPNVFSMSMSSSWQTGEGVLIGGAGKLQSSKQDEQNGQDVKIESLSGDLAVLENNGGLLGMPQEKKTVDRHRHMPSHETDQLIEETERELAEMERQLGKGGGWGNVAVKNDLHADGLQAEAVVTEEENSQLQSIPRKIPNEQEKVLFLEAEELGEKGFSEFAETVGKCEDQSTSKESRSNVNGGTEDTAGHETEADREYSFSPSEKSLSSSTLLAPFLASNSSGQRRVKGLEETDQLDELRSKRSTEAKKRGKQDVLLFVDLQLGPETSDRVTVRRGDSSDELAASFVAKHRLQTSYTQIISDLLKKQIDATAADEAIEARNMPAATSSSTPFFSQTPSASATSNASLSTRPLNPDLAAKVASPSVPLDSAPIALPTHLAAVSLRYERALMARREEKRNRQSQEDPSQPEIPESFVASSGLLSTGSMVPASIAGAGVGKVSKGVTGKRKRSNRFVSKAITQSSR